MQTDTYSHASELDHREGDGIAVTLLWYEDERRVVVRVADSRNDDGFELDVPAAAALDAFHHPFAYAARPPVRGQLRGEAHAPAA